ncbi:MAG: AAA family ATPase [Parcubacteria group bacterium]|jgi:ATP-dependent 26S proteasome regulatory subunit
MKGTSAISITEKELREKLKDAQPILKEATFTVKVGDESSTPTLLQSSPGGQEEEQSISVWKLIHDINSEDDLLSDMRSHALLTIRRGIQIGLHISSAYGARAGIPDSNRETGTQAQITEISEKKQTAAAIALFSMTRYIMWNMQSVLDNNAFLDNVNIVIDEVELSRTVPAIKGAVFFLGKNIESQVGKDDARLAAVVYKYAEVLQDDILNRMDSFKHTSVFTDVTYQLEETDFVIAGFEEMTLSQNTVEVKEVYPADVIGSSKAVAEVEDAVSKLFLYDFETQTHPIKDLGGIQSPMLLSGPPGNGKTLLLSLARTLARDYAAASGLPFRDLVVPNMVSKMQGESSDLAKAFLQKLLDPRTINLGIGDEFEAVMPNHGSDDVSEGDKKVAVEFLKGLSGVSSVDRMNFLFMAATNFPENIDPAFMNRVKSRNYIAGAETMQDYIRFIVMNLRKLNQRYPNLINLTGVDWNMDLRSSRMADDMQVLVDPRMGVADIQAKALEHYAPDDIRFFALFFHMMKSRQKTFSLRDCDNAIGGAKAHLAGFKVPLEWITEQRHYIVQPSEVKTGLVTDLAKDYVATSGINFVQIFTQKIMYYAEEALRMAEVKQQREIEEYAEKRLVNYLGEEAFKKKLGLLADS